FVVIGAVWFAVTASGLVKPIFLPNPVDVVLRLVEQAQNGQLWSDIGISVLRIMSAFLVAAVVAVPLGLLMGRIRFFEALLVPITEFIRYMPVVAFTPLTVVWFGVDEVQKLVLIFLGTFFALLLMVMDDVQRVPREYVESSRTFGMPEHRILARVVLRAAMPSIWDSFRLALGWCWSWLVLGELVAATSGLGYRITLGQRYLDTSLIIGYILVLGLLGLITDQVLRLSKRALFGYLKK
ncbi:MAG: ABC transporter permease, partial [Herbiconiux sp.]|nr:ABC transporter permease [Herbiconiux sp.]